MPTKDYFNTDANSPLSMSSIDEVGKKVESQRYMEAKTKSKERYIPNVDFSTASHFVRFGSAKEYYEQATKRIFSTYPYDGSRYEQQAWMNSSSYLDLHIYNTEYPKTTGYVTFGTIAEGAGSAGWGTKITMSNNFGETTERHGFHYGYGAPATSSYEYIFIKGGPHPDDNENYKTGTPNKYDLWKHRESNLKIGGINGNTVEFWMKKSAFDLAKTQKEVILDVWTTSSISSSTDYGRLTILMSGHGANHGTVSPFFVTYMSGVYGIESASIGSGITTASVADDKWHHYAFVFQDATASSATNTRVSFYMDGKLNHSIETGSNISYVSGNLIAALGALVTAPSAAEGALLREPGIHSIAADATQQAQLKGWGKLSASLDEFRYWKVARTTEEIAGNYFKPVYGGSNTDDSNTHLGIYYKFNEGITGTSSVDDNVLDYSGRLSNGDWTGYSGSTFPSRNTGSAIVSSSAAAFEESDPIIYSHHYDVTQYYQTKSADGKTFDQTNPSSFYNMMPEWIQSEDVDNQGELKKLTQIMSNYFDSLSLQIKELSGIQHQKYYSITSSIKPRPFAEQLLNSKGFVVPEIFADATIMEQYGKSNEERVFSDDLSDVKDFIYENIYNNLNYIYKSKGTEKAFRNLIRCFGIDDDLIKLNVYGNNISYEIKDNYRFTSKAKKYANFYPLDNKDAIVFQAISTNVSNSVSFVSASGMRNLLSGTSHTFEAEVVFPKHVESSYYNLNMLQSSSLFGVHEAISSGAAGQTTQNDTTWKTSKNAADLASIQVYAVRPSTDYNHVFFKATSSYFGINLTSSLFTNVYDNQKWNFAVRVRPPAEHWANQISGSYVTDLSSGSFEFYGINADHTTIHNEFVVTGNLAEGVSGVSGNVPVAKYKEWVNAAKRFYIGADRTDFTGSVLTPSNVKIASFRYWLKNLTNQEIKSHAIDIDNYGTEHPGRSAFLFEGASNSFKGQNIPGARTLVMHWDFANITGSDANGEFIVNDFSSGSNNVIDPNNTGKFGLISEIIDRQHTAKGAFFPVSTTASIDVTYSPSAKQLPIETVGSSDMVQILDQDDIQFTLETRPINYYFAVEKSPYASISEEMMNMFASIKDFHNLIGEPVNRYRQKYKNLEKLRQIFFERVGNTPDVERYIDYYKWIDSAINDIIIEIFPASADVSPSVRTTIESHVLERNKYKTKFPTLEPKGENPVGGLKGASEMKYDHKDGSAPMPSSPRDQRKNTSWWKKRANREQSELSSSTNATAVDAIDTTGVAAPGSDCSFTINIPSAAGGEGGAITILLDQSATTDPAEGANKIAIGWNGKNDAEIAALVIKAINGTTDSLIDYASSGRGTAGVGGVTAKEGSSNTQVTLTIDTTGRDGNISSALATASGVNVIDVTDFGGAVATDFDSKRETLNRIINTFVSGNSFEERNFSRPYDATFQLDKGLHDLSKLRNQGLHKNILEPFAHSGSTPSNILAVTASDFVPDDQRLVQADRASDPQDLMTKKKKQFFFVENKSDNSTYGNKLKGEAALPFSLYTSSRGLEVTNLHHDYDTIKGTPLQGPFTEKYVGGHQHRHQDLTLTGGLRHAVVDITTRPEAFRINIFNEQPTGSFITAIDADFTGTLYVVGSNLNTVNVLNSDLPRASRFRDVRSKRPVNIRNIQQLTSSSTFSDTTTIGNYSKNYEIIQTSGRKNNDSYFVSVAGAVSSSIASSMVGGHVVRPLTERTRQESVIVERFSAPGGYEVNSRGYLDAAHEEYSVYNALPWRNLTVRIPLTNLYKSHTGKYGVNSSASAIITVTDSDNIAANDSIILTATDGTVVVCSINNNGGTTTSTATDGDVEAATVSSNDASAATNIATAINHNPRFSATAKENVVTVVQATGGIDGNTQVIVHDASTAGISYTDFRGGSGGNKPNDLSRANFHKVHSNPRRFLVLAPVTGAHADSYAGGSSRPEVITASNFDNYYIQHMIPQSDLQYAWITASVAEVVMSGNAGSSSFMVKEVNGHHVFRRDTLQTHPPTGGSYVPFGYQQPDYTNASLASTNLAFVSQSNTWGAIPALGSWLVYADSRLYPGSRAMYIDPIGLNKLIHDPISGSDNTLGYPIDSDGGGGSIAKQKGLLAEYINPGFLIRNRVDTDYGSDGQDVSSITFNFHDLMINRNGFFGYPSWKQVRTGEHKVARHHRRNNILSIHGLKGSRQERVDPTDYTNDISTKRKDTSEIKNFKVTPVTSKYKPLLHTVRSPSDPDVQGRQTFDEISLRHTYGNEAFFFPVSGGILDNRLGLAPNRDEQMYDEITNAIDRDELHLQNLVYRETIFPKEEYTYLSQNRQRINYTESKGAGPDGYDRRSTKIRSFWRDSIHDRLRTIMGAADDGIGALNSMGHLLHTSSLRATTVPDYMVMGEVHESHSKPVALSMWPLDSPGKLSRTMDEAVGSVGPIGQAIHVGELWGDTIFTMTGTAAGAGGSSGTDESSATASQGFMFPTYLHDQKVYKFNDVAHVPGQEYANFKFSAVSVTDMAIYAHTHFKPQYSCSAQAGRGPWFDSYEEYSEDIRRIGKDYSILPEFRISEHMEYYLNNGFFADNSKFLTLDGARLTSSADNETSDPQNEFYKIYAHSDFLQHMQVIKDDYTSAGKDAKLARLTLKCKGIKKLLPYNGFYPVNRCLQLGTLFSESFGPYLTASVRTQAIIPKAVQMQSLLQPFFAPGIMYNTIKSGIAVDWPLFTGSAVGSARIAPWYLLTASMEGDTAMPALGVGPKNVHSLRLPFEALVEPDKYLPKNENPENLYNRGLHSHIAMDRHSGSKIPLIIPGFGHGGINSNGFTNNKTTDWFPERWDLHCIWKGQSEVKYNLAMHNFLGEIPRFFLKDERLTTFASKKGPFMMASGTTYFMDVVLEKNRDTVIWEGPESTTGIGIRFTSKNHLTGASYRGMHYGPACQWSTDVSLQGNDNHYDPAYAPYTPPYFYGPSTARIAFTPHIQREMVPDRGPESFTLEEILRGAEVETMYEPDRSGSYSSINTAGRVPTEDQLAAISKMQIDSSIKLFGRTRLKEVTYQPSALTSRAGNPSSIKDGPDASYDVWTISSKFETPILNFSDSAGVAGVGGNIPYTRGVWMQYGRLINTASNGVYLSLRESYPTASYTPRGAKTRTADAFTTRAQLAGPENNNIVTGSLLKVCGFESGFNKRRLGRVADTKLISEAIVAIPFSDDNVNDVEFARGGTPKMADKFYTITRDQIRAAQQLVDTPELAEDMTKKLRTLAGSSIEDMVRKMQKYVIPPHLDFLTNADINPFVMYMFEFEHVLDKQDLADIWQNVMPKIAMTAEKDESIISHDIGKSNEFFGTKEIPSDTRWMVFKVKRIAEKNYFAVTADSTDDARFKFEFAVDSEKTTPDYSYNWPYDFFSLVELAKVEAEVSIEHDPDLLG